MRPEKYIEHLGRSIGCPRNIAFHEKRKLNVATIISEKRWEIKKKKKQ